MTFLQKMRKEKLIFVFLVLIQFIANLSALDAEPEKQVLVMATSGALLMLLSVYVLCLQRKNMLSFVLSIAIAYFNYSLAAGVYWSADSLPRIFDAHTYNEFLYGINLVLVFFVVYLCCLKENPKSDISVFLERESCDWLITMGCAGYISAAPFLFYYTESFGTRGIASAFYEYSLVVLIIALAFCGRNLKALAVLILASGWIILHGLLHGERALALQMLIIWGVYLLLHRFSLKLIIPGCVVGVFVFTLFGLYRGISALEGDVLRNVFFFLKNGKLANDTSFAAFQTSLNVIRFAEMSSFAERLILFFKYLLYIVAGSAVKNVNLALLALEAGVHGGGGWLPGYFFFWLGYPGVILSGAALGWFVNKISCLSKENRFRNYLALYVVATVPRWYLYSPSALTRGLLIFIVLFTVAAIVHRYSGQVCQLCTNQVKKWRKK